MVSDHAELMAPSIRASKEVGVSRNWLWFLCDSLCLWEDEATWDSRGTYKANQP